MATAITGTHVNFVKVPTTAKFADITTKEAGTIYFIVDVKKIYLDGVMYGFNDTDIDLTPFLKHDGSVKMTGNMDMSGNYIYGLSNIGGGTGNTSASLRFQNPTADNVEIRLRILDDVVDGDESHIIFTQQGLEFSTRGNNIATIKGLNVIGPSDTDFENLHGDHALSVGTLQNFKGANGGFAELDSSGVVPTGQLPSYVDDIMEFPNKESFPATGEAAKIYVDLTNSYMWRWGGSGYYNVSDGNASLKLGSTSSTAHRGDHGKTAYNHTKLDGPDDNPHDIQKGNVGLGSVENYGIASSAEAKAGNVNNKYMTPQRTKEAVQVLAPRLTWEVVS